MAIKWTESNSKLVKTSGGSYKVLGYGIKADYDVILMGQHIHTCPGASACKAICYAKQGFYMMPNVDNARINNIRESLMPSFVENAITDLRFYMGRGYNTVRIHDAGDMYNQEYYNKWCDIARALPDMIFYSYTKALNLDLYTNKPDNLRLIQSLGGKYDSMVDLSRPHSRVFATHDALDAAGYVNGSETDLAAIEGIVNIGLCYHGIRKLTLPQVKFFS